MQWLRFAVAVGDLENPNLLVLECNLENMWRNEGRVECRPDPFCQGDGRSNQRQEPQQYAAPANDR
jgi:hypothetical protein